LREIEQIVRRFNSKLAVARSIHTPTNVRFSDGRTANPQTLQGKRIFAFCGIGNPAAFFDTVRRLGCEIAGTQVFDDHYRYTDACLGQIHEQAAECGGECVLTTQKDWTKVGGLNLPKEAPFFAYLAIELQLTTGATEVTALIDRALSGKMLCL
jgi:tetraacyldisaccharide 4'-kinase